MGAILQQNTDQPKYVSIATPCDVVQSKSALNWIIEVLSTIGQL